MKMKVAKAFTLVMLSGTLSVTYLAQPASTVEGIVVETGTDSPLQGVKLSLVPEDVPPDASVAASGNKSAITDDRGQFSLQEVMPGRYRVIAERAGFVLALPSQLPGPPVTWLRIGAGQQIRGVELKMVPQAVITGRVVGTDGRPVPAENATVTLMRYTYNESGTRRLSSVPGLTYRGAGSFVNIDDRGEYRFYGLLPGDYYVVIRIGSTGGSSIRVSAPTYYPGTMEESKAEAVHVDAGQELRLSTVTIHQVDAQIRLNFPDGNPPVARTIFYGGGLIAAFPSTFPSILGGSSVPNPTMTLILPQGHYEMFITSGDSYGTLTFQLGSTDLERDVVLSPGAEVKGRVLLENENGGRQPFTPGEGRVAFRCSLRSESVQSFCSLKQDGTVVLSSVFGSFAGIRGVAIPPGFYRLEIQEMPADVYVLAMTSSGQDVLKDGIQVRQDTEFEVVLSKLGGTLAGAVRDSRGNRLASAVVALIPDEPFRDAGPRFRSASSDINGQFELTGIAPGDYHLFAWRELEGAAYRNAEFMKDFEDRGTPVHIEKRDRKSIDLTAF